MSTKLGLCYTKILGNRIYYSLIFTFLWRCFLKNFFAQGPNDYKKFLNWSILFIVGILKGTNNPGLSEPGSNGYEQLLHTPQISRIGVTPPDAAKCHMQNISLLIPHTSDLVPNEAEL